jgi:hypothetical protein
MAQGISVYDPNASGSGGYFGRPAASANTFFPTMPQGYSMRDVLMHRVNPGFARAYSGGRQLPIMEAMSRGPLYHSGWATSGVGPGTQGYRGSYYGGGYNYGQGTRRPSAKNSSEYYALRDAAEGGNAIDRLRWNEGRGQPWRSDSFNGNDLMRRIVEESRGAPTTTNPATAPGPGTSGGSAADAAAINLGGAELQGMWGGLDEIASATDELAPMPVVPLPSNEVPKDVSDWLNWNSDSPTSDSVGYAKPMKGFSSMDKISLGANNAASSIINNPIVQRLLFGAQLMNPMNFFRRG